MLLITEDLTREDLIEALTNLRHEAGRVTYADAKYAALHDDMNRIIDHLEHADH